MTKCALTPGNSEFFNLDYGAVQENEADGAARGDR